MAFGDVCLIFGTLLSLGIAVPGLLVAWALLLPDLVGRARLRLAHTPGQCFGLGIGWLFVFLVPLRVLFAVPGGGVALGWFGIVTLLAAASVGAAGLAALMGERLRLGGLAASPPGATLRGAVALELAAIIPLIGWLVVLPIVVLCALGAVGFALLRWLPRPAGPPPLPSLPIAAPPYMTQLPTAPVAWSETGVGHGRHTS